MSEPLPTGSDLRDGSGDRRFWMAAVAATLLVGGTWAARAPGGSWSNRVYDLEMWLNDDPGGSYIPAAHDLILHPGTSCYSGHPGLPLQFLLAIEQLVLWSLARVFGSTLDITSFVARNTRAVWTVATSSMLLLHLASFAALYRFSLVLTPSRQNARLAVCLYATSFPLLYYLTRVSVEPTVVIFFLATAVCVARAASPPEGRATPVAWASLAGLCSISAFFSKVHLMAPWPLVAGVFLAAVRIQGGARRSRLLLAYTATCAIAAAAYGVFLDWTAFSASWIRVSHADVDPTVPGFFFGMTRVIASGFARTLEQAQLATFLPSFTRFTVFSHYEVGFLALATLGAAYASRRDGRVRRDLLGFMMAYCVFVLGVWWYREGTGSGPSFHYLFPVAAVISPIAAMGLARIAPFLVDPRTRSLSRVVGLAGAIAAVHGAGFLAVVDSKHQDSQEFARLHGESYAAALRQAGSNKTVAVFDGWPTDYHGLSDGFALPDRPSSLVAELHRLYMSRRRPFDCVQVARQARRRDVGAVLDFALADPGPRTLAEWEALPEAGRCSSGTDGRGSEDR